MFATLAVVRGDVLRTVAIVVDAVTHRAITIIINNGKTPVHRQRQQRHRDEGNNAIATTVKTPAHRHHHNDDSRTEDVCSTFYFFIECRGRVTTH